MANEFIARNGLIAQKDSVVTGSLTTTAATYVGGNLSVGTTYNGQRLNVNGDAYIISGKIYVSDGFGLVNAYNAGSGFITYDNSNIAIKSNNISTIFITGSNQNVGIGTTTPNAKLSVNGAISVLAGTIPNGNGLHLGFDGATGYISGYDAGVDWRNIDYNGSLHTFRTVDNERMRITSAGNVGIGTTTPNTKLSITSVWSNGTDSPLISSQVDSETLNKIGTYVESTTTAATAMTFYTHPANSSTSEKMRITSAGNVGIGTTTPAEKLEVSTTGNTTGVVQLLKGDTSYGATTTYSRAGNFTWDIGIGAAASNGLPYSYFGVAEQGTIPRLVIAHTTGNVGIGTTSPSNKLDVSGSIRATQYVYANDAFVGDDIISAGNRDFIVNKTTAYSIILSTSGSERMRIDSAGNVGIGTTSPYSKLDVSGAISMNGAYFAANNATYTQIYKAQSNSVGLYIGGAGDPQNYYDNTQHFFRSSGGGTTYAIINSSGNVGIGTTAPTAKLEVSGGVGDIFAFQNQVGRYYYSGYAFNTPSSHLINIGSSGYWDVNNGGGNIRLDSAGNVGIGTTAPTAKLTVVGGSQYIYGATDTSLVIGDTLGAEDYGQIVWQTSSNTLQIYGSGTIARPVILQPTNGNVGIGTTSPNAKLDVNGNAIITGSLSVTGSTVVTGSVRGQVSALTITSNTASIDLASNNFFTLTLANATNTHISASNIQPGQTANIRITQGSLGTGTVSFNSAIKSGSYYTGSAIANAIDIATFISFDSSTLYMSAVTNLK
jgi:hypothetical protein